MKKVVPTEEGGTKERGEMETETESHQHDLTGSPRKLTIVNTSFSFATLT